MTETHFGSSTNQIAHAVLDTELDTTPANAVVVDAVARFCRPVDQRELHDVFIVISQGADGEHIASGRFTPPTSTTPAKHTHDNYANEPLVAVHQ